MASAENQGKTIALVIMIVMFVASAATAYYFYDKVDGAEKQRAAALKEKNDTDSLLRKSQTEYGELRSVVGATNANAADHQEVLKQCMAKLVNPNAQSIRKQRSTTQRRASFDSFFNMIDGVNTMVAAQDKELAAFDDDKAALQSQLASSSSIYNDKNATTEEQLQKRRDELKDETDKSMKTLEDNDQKLRDAQKRYQETLAKLEQLKTDSSAKIEDLEKSLSKLDLLMERVIARQRRGEETRFNLEDGELVEIMAGGNEAYINVGRTDGVSEGLTFGVYGTDRTGFTQSLPKANLEVVRILGDHQALARIFDFKIEDPVIPGDKIFNPIWDRGKKNGVAILGVIDLDGDGRPDNDEFRRLVERWGGRIDAEVDMKTFKPIGRITIDTSWLVEGVIPEAAEAGKEEAGDAEQIRKGMIDAAQKFRTEARSHAVRPVNVSNFLAFMGHRLTPKLQNAGEEEIFRERIRKQKTQRLQGEPGVIEQDNFDLDRSRRDIFKAGKRQDNSKDKKADADADADGNKKKPGGEKPKSKAAKDSDL